MTQLNFIFGLGIFLFGMSQLEYGIRKLGDARLRYWLRSSTGSRLGSVTTGVVSTAILQSSSMMSLLVLAFASAGILPLVNAVGILLGANLGTTVTGWLVAIFGFKLDLEAMGLPLLGLSAMALTLTPRDTRASYTGYLVLGIALLLFGLGIMKTSMETLPQRWDVSVIQGHHAIVYLLFGVVITMLVQSSSAVMMMALAALNAEFIALPEAAALIIGADLGTTSTTALASLTGSVIKRQLAFAHVMFNVIVDLLAFLFLLPALPWLLSLLSLEDPLLSLVAFHSTFNVLGLLGFLPFLDPFTRWIEKVFGSSTFKSGNVLDRVPANVPDAALVALRDTVKQLILQAACNALSLFELKPARLDSIEAQREPVIGSELLLDFDSGYEQLKSMEGNIFSFALRIQSQPLQEIEALNLERLQLAVRHTVFCNKTLKDIREDLAEMKYSSSDSTRELYEKHRHYHRSVYERLMSLLLDDHNASYVAEELSDILQHNDQYTASSTQFVQANLQQAMAEDDTSVSSQLNSNREIHHAVKTLIEAIELLNLEKHSQQAGG
jgi:phosphate:Na+ symporter